MRIGSDSSRAVTVCLWLVAANVSYLAFPPFDLPGLGWVCFVPLLLLLERLRSSLRAQLVAVGLYATWGYTIGYWWVAGTLQEFGGIPALPSFGLLALFALLGSTTFVPFVLLLHVWRRVRGERRTGTVLVVTGLWIAMESWWPRLFPWYAGLTQHDAAIARQLAELGGVTAISSVVMIANVVLAELVLMAWRRRRPAPTAAAELVLALVVVATALGWAATRRAAVEELTPERTLRVALIQGNVSNQEKNDSEGEGGRGEHVVSRYMRLSIAAARDGAELIVWPETAYPWFVCDRPLDQPGAREWDEETRQRAASFAQNLERLRRLSRACGTPLLVGGLEASGRPQDFGAEQNFNAALLVDGTRPLETYRKIVLIPFGERVPEPLDTMMPWIADRMPRRFTFSAGESTEPLEVMGTRLAVSICYEAILADLCRTLVVDGDADVLVNLTNDSWFGQSGEPAQHLAMASLRAVELRVPLLRATNSGITAMVDASGRVHEPTDLFVEAAPIHEVELLPIARDTLFARHGSLLPEILGALGLLTVAAAALGAAREKRAQAAATDA
jgi:apolipoprotein N-acyltransferase